MQQQRWLSKPWLDLTQITLTFYSIFLPHIKKKLSGVVKWRQIGHNWKLTVSISVGANLLIILEFGPRHKVGKVKSVCLYKRLKLVYAGYYILWLFMLSSLNWLLAKVSWRTKRVLVFWSFPAILLTLVFFYLFETDGKELTMKANKGRNPKPHQERQERWRKERIIVWWTGGVL